MPLKGQYEYDADGGIEIKAPAKVALKQKTADGYVAVLNNDWRYDDSQVIEAKSEAELDSKIAYAQERADRWVTINGAHVLINNRGMIVGGAGGKLNGMRFNSRFRNYKGAKVVRGRRIVGAHFNAQTESVDTTEHGQFVNGVRRQVRGKASQFAQKNTKERRRFQGNKWTGRKGGTTLTTTGVENGRTVTSGAAANKDHVLKLSPAAQTAYDKARRAEPGITKDLVDISKQLGMQMTGLKYSVKTATSVESKVRRKSGGKRLTAKQEAQIIGQMGDLVRYTQMGKHADLAKNTKIVMDTLQKSGYKIAKLDNKYLDKNSDYKGIHLDVVSPSGQKFELQIHSKESMAVKNKLHPIYEKSRIMPKGSPERLKLEKQMREISAGLAMPDGIEDLLNIG